ncbi:Family Y DNA polymerase [Halapricum desulfuricans]|uniref:DNA polymerase IV n=1 Tax=Halapricum desulfuricans TaxID=2841257 RepID=A0A897NHQ8_9EURY|nr:DNA polymerase IV [Halapricum desulfuricans]QSG12257.1 Family Y DNA polymerase [Halapricum desulfuricans]
MPERARLPGVDRRPEQIVCHVDMDCFYAACERLREPQLRGEPVVVGMGYEDGDDHGAVATASYEARAFGVESAMAISEALERLPRRAETDGTGASERDSAEETGYYRPVDMDYYESVSEDVRAILRDSADVVRAVSIDEAYLDVTDRTDWDGVEGVARNLKARIESAVGVVASVGVAPTMSAAKIASDADKPDGLVVVEPGDVREFLAPMDVEAVHNVGPVTARELREMGIQTAGDLADSDPDRLVDRFGERGREIYRFARGEDAREVTPRDDPKSFSRESAFSEPVADIDLVYERVRTLATAVAERARRESALYQTIGIKVVTPPYDVHTRARSLSGPVDDPELVEAIATDLLAEFDDARVRKVGVRVSKLSFTDREQASLDGFDDSDEQAGQEQGDRSNRGPEHTRDDDQLTLSDF